MDPLFYDSWQGVLRVAISAPITYVAVIAMIRMSGKRSTSQMNNFDWIVTVAIGSISASGILSQDVALAESLAGIGVLLLCQYILTRSVLRNEALSQLVKPPPTLLFSHGEFLDDAMAKERVSRHEVRAAVRNHGLSDMSRAQWVILETDASFSVIPVPEEEANCTSMCDVSGYGAGRQEQVIADASEQSADATTQRTER